MRTATSKYNRWPIPPSPGQKVAMIVGCLALAIARPPMPPFAISKLWFVIMLLAAAPVDVFVMPALGTGFGLLNLILIYSLAFGFLGGRSPVRKSGPIILFVVMTGLSNQQRHSFEGLIDGAQMIVVAVMYLALVSLFFLPARPEQDLSQSLGRLFLRLCTRLHRIGSNWPLRRWQCSATS